MLLDEILANPASVEARLVYADHLIEQGDPRGEMIQMQCNAERLTVDDPARAEMLDRADDLFALHETAWTREIRELGLGSDMTQLTFRRGFVEKAWIGASKIPEVLPVLRGLTPIRHVSVTARTIGAIRAVGPPLVEIEQVSLSTLGRDIDRAEAGRTVAAWPHAGRIRMLDASVSGLVEAIASEPGIRGLVHLRNSSMKPAELAAICSSPHLDTLTRLDMPNSSSIGSDGVRAIVSAQTLAKLTTLDLDRSNLDPAAAELLAAAPHAAQLATLRLVGNPLGAKGVAALAASLTAIEVLDLEGVKPGEQGASALFSSGLPVRRLDISKNALGDRDFARAIGGVRLPALEALVTVGNDLGVESMRAIAAANLDGLRWLELASNAIGDAGLIQLARTRRLAGLSRLGLDRCGIGAEGCAALGASDLGARLRQLDLGHCAIGDDAVRSLVEAGRLDHLVDLDLGGAQLTPAGIRALAASPVGARLRHLTLDGSSPAVVHAVFERTWPELRSLYVEQVDDAAAAVLARTRGMPMVRQLYLRANDLSDDGIESLVEAQLDRMLWMELYAPNVSDVGRAELRRHYAHHAYVFDQALLRDFDVLGRRI